MWHNNIKTKLCQKNELAALSQPETFQVTKFVKAPSMPVELNHLSAFWLLKLLMRLLSHTRPTATFISCQQMSLLASKIINETCERGSTMEL